MSYRWCQNPYCRPGGCTAGSWGPCEGGCGLWYCVTAHEEPERRGVPQACRDKVCGEEKRGREQARRQVREREESGTIELADR